MAVVPKHEDQNARYDPKKDFTGDQMHRFTEVANKAQRRKEALETKRSAFSSVKEKAMRPIITPKEKISLIALGTQCGLLLLALLDFGRCI